MNEVNEDWKLFDKSSRGIMKTTGDKYLFVRTMLQRFGADIQKEMRCAREIHNTIDLEIR